MIVALMGVMVMSWAVGSTSRVAAISFMLFTMLRMSLLLCNLVYLLSVESNYVLDFLEHFLTSEEELIFSYKTALSPQTFLVVGLHGLFIEMMKQINKHFQHNLGDNQCINHVDNAKNILVFHLDSRLLLIKVAFDLI